MANVTGKVSSASTELLRSWSFIGSFMAHRVCRRSQVRSLHGLRIWSVVISGLIYLRFLGSPDVAKGCWRSIASSFAAKALDLFLWWRSCCVSVVEIGRVMLVGNFDISFCPFHAGVEWSLVLLFKGILNTHPKIHL